MAKPTEKTNPMAVARTDEPKDITTLQGIPTELRSFFGGLIQVGVDPVLPSDFVEESNPPFIGVRDIPEGGIVEGRLLKYIPSFKTEFNGKLMLMISPGGIKFCFPLTRVIECAIDKRETNKDKAQKLLDAAVGKYFVLQFLGKSGEDTTAKKAANRFKVLIGKTRPDHYIAEK